MVKRCDVTRWPDDEQHAWRAFYSATTLLMDRLDRELQHDAGMPHAYYEILVVLSESPGRSLRMSELAVLTRSSRSRPSPTPLGFAGDLPPATQRGFR